MKPAAISIIWAFVIIILCFCSPNKLTELNYIGSVECLFAWTLDFFKLLIYLVPLLFRQFFREFEEKTARKALQISAPV